MASFSSIEYPPADELTVRIVDNDKVLTLDYTQCTAVHQRSLWWGTAVGFRAMQMAAIALSKDSLWHREGLSVISAHPGPGVLDSINFVTGCRDTDQLTVIENENCVNRCNSEMKFEWWVSDGEQTAFVKLNDGFVPIEFYQLMDRRAYDETVEGDDELFELFKVNMSSRIFVAPLERNFTFELLPPLENGQIPSTHEWIKKTA